MKVTPCECAKPGWCERHRCEKSRHNFELCRRRKDWFEAFESKQTVIQQISRTNIRKADCIHRKNVISERECQTCSGNVRIKVFSCELHNSCTVRKPIEDLPCCITCEDYQR